MSVTCVIFGTLSHVSHLLFTFLLEFVWKDSVGCRVSVSPMCHEKSNQTHCVQLLVWSFLPFLHLTFQKICDDYCFIFNVILCQFPHCL